MNRPPVLPILRLRWRQLVCRSGLHGWRWKRWGPGEAAHGRSVWECLNCGWTFVEEGRP